MYSSHPHVIQDVFLSSVEKKLRGFEAFQDFLHSMGTKWFKVQMSFSAASKGFKRHQMVNKGLVK